MKQWHIGLCIAFVALGVALVAAGANALAFSAALGCAAMMGVMVWMMVRR